MDLDGVRWEGRDLTLAAAAVRSGVIDEVEGSTAEDVAETLDLEPEAVERFLKGLLSEELLERDGEGHRLTPEGRRLLPGGDRRFTVLQGAAELEGLLGLTEALREGGAVGGEGRFDGGWEVFVGAMAEKEPELFEGAVEVCLERFPGAERVLDVGGGPGLSSRAFAERGMDVTLFDREEALEAAGPGPEGVERVAGDLRRGLPDGEFDLVFAGNVLHMFPDDAVEGFFGDAAPLLSEGGGVAVLDYLSEMSPDAGLFDLNLLANRRGGRVRSLGEFEALLLDAGFVDVEVESVGEEHLLTAGRR